MLNVEHEHEHEHEHGHLKIEAGQICNPDHFPPPNELVCIQVPKIFDQVALRDCLTRTVTLIPGSGVYNPMFSFEGAGDFDIVEVKIISKTDSMTRPGFKKLKIFVKVKYNIFYSDGINQLSQPDEAAFNLTVNEIYCPSCLAQIGVIRYPEAPYETIDEDGQLLKVEGLIEAFNDAVNSTTGVLTLDVGGFFVVKCACEVQLLIPAYGYCPVPPEQVNAAAQSCRSFNDRQRTPFPTTFFPNQKWNPLDKKECDC